MKTLKNPLSASLPYGILPDWTAFGVGKGVFIMETWKDIEDFKGFYQISSTGEVKSLKRVAKIMHMMYRVVKERILIKSFDTDGYHKVLLRNGEIQKNAKIHRLVALYFIPNPDNKPEVNHINGIKTDNRFENLEWVTGKENTDHAFKTGLRIGLIGDKNHFSKLTPEMVIEIRAKGKYSTYRQIAEDNNMSLNAIVEILKRKTWTHI